MNKEEIIKIILEVLSQGCGETFIGGKDTYFKNLLLGNKKFVCGEKGFICSNCKNRLNMIKKKLLSDL